MTDHQLILALALLIVVCGLLMAKVAHGRRYPPDRRPGYITIRKPRQ